jgi:anti-sigma regulatory factor (Ser/Thr protein kinase)
VTAQAFGLTRQGVHRHLQRLLRDQALSVLGTTRNRRYTLRPRTEWMEDYALSDIVGEDVLWSRDIRPVLGHLPANVLDIWQYGFTEMMNNALEHSAGQRVGVVVTQTAFHTQMLIADDGEGIFRKLQRELGLADERHAVLELGKGKVTTDPAHHSGEGIFFTSRMFDHFTILSGNVSFAHRREKEYPDDPLDWIGKEQQFTQGTAVRIDLKNTVTWTTKEVFDQFSTDEDYGFTKTVVPVHLAQYGDEKLVSRSQAKRLLAGMERFRVVLLDFAGVETIGQAFADEVFRVFVMAHPKIELYAGHANTAVLQMIRHVAGARADDLLADEEA